MCLAKPVQIKKLLSKSKCQLEDKRMINTSLVSETLQTGDWLLCHADLAINKIDQSEAKEILALNRACLHGR
ncbi:MAG: HypC/HybG/HupF family hydrogenase formation chaperone [Patescibacteria group bacterium]